MYDTYSKAIGTDIMCVLANAGIQINQIESCIKKWGQDSNEFHKAVASIQRPFAVSGLGFALQTDAQMSRYFTLSESGQFHYWEYDYKHFFPAVVTPYYTVACNNEEQVERIKSVLFEHYGSRVTISIKHPILGEKITFPLQVDPAKCRFSHTHHVMEIKMNPVKVPWIVYWPQYDIKQCSQGEQAFFCEYLYAIAQLWHNRRTQRKTISKDDIIALKLEDEKLVLLNSVRVEFLDLLEIPNDMWTLEKIEALNSSVQNSKITLEDAIIEYRKQEERTASQESQDHVSSRTREQSYHYRDQYERSDYSSYDSSRERQRAEERERRERQRAEENAREEERKRRVAAESDERRRRARESQRQWEAVRKANEERRRKGLPELPLPYREYY